MTSALRRAAERRLEWTRRKAVDLRAAGGVWNRIASRNPTADNCAMAEAYRRELQNVEDSIRDLVFDIEAAGLTLRAEAAVHAERCERIEED